MILELSAKQVRKYAVPLIYECMGDEIGEQAETAWANDSGDETWLYAIFDAEGLVGIGGLGSEISKRKIWLGYLAVRPNQRRCGVGRQLLSHVEGVARSRGYREIYVETYDHPTFAAARQLYEKTGYSQIGELPEYLDDGSDALYYRKKLI